MKKTVIVSVALMLIALYGWMNYTNGLLEKYNGETTYNGTWVLDTIDGVSADQYKIAVYTLTSSISSGVKTPEETWEINGNDIVITGGLYTTQARTYKINYTSDGFDILSEDKQEIYKSVCFEEVNGVIILKTMGTDLSSSVVTSSKVEYLYVKQS